ncbi:ABC transporter permease subunit [Verticiella alkaliphila]|uniref:ABC transporter permease subunit n=1 Tax=Verticiella alkaliphila TaxID=2779529 RepID=UPI00209B4752|nr:hypothetical protein [Verticiella sp. GG226]
MPHRLTFLVCVAALAVLPLLWPSPYGLSVIAAAGIMIIAAISLNLLLGFAGQLSLGQAAFFGIGAYTSALLSLGFDVSLGFGAPWWSSPSRCGSPLAWASWWLACSAGWWASWRFVCAARISSSSPSASRR